MLSLPLFVYAISYIAFTILSGFTKDYRKELNLSIDTSITSCYLCYSIVFMVVAAMIGSLFNLSFEDGLFMGIMVAICSVVLALSWVWLIDTTVKLYKLYKN